MKEENIPFRYDTYGARQGSGEVVQFLRHLLGRTFHEEPDPYQPPTPVCIWGRHGIGKTQLVRELARELGCRFAYIAPAQFEEMGDLIGMPKVVTGAGGSEVSRFMPPEWAPREPGPGILLIDDVNRADDRILRGIMQLLQNHELVSWRLPPRWHIILTANPDGGDYSVTPLDDAMLTRMLHVTLVFEVKSWARWAERAGVDPRGIEFVLSYPEVVTGRRTTPRTLVQFFREIAPIPDLTTQQALVRTLAEACLDVETGAAFLSFIRNRTRPLPSPEEILTAEDFDLIRDRLQELVDGPTLRLDILSVVSARLVNYLLAHRPELPERSFQNLLSFLTFDLLPNDLRLSLAQDLAGSDHPPLQRLLSAPAIGKLLLDKM